MAGQEELLNALRLVKDIQSSFGGRNKNTVSQQIDPRQAVTTGPGNGAMYIGPDPNVTRSNRNAVNARSGGNVKVTNDVDLSNNYRDALNDAIGFYQKEFKMTPHADLYNDQVIASQGALGVTKIIPDDTGQHAIDLLNLTERDERYAKDKDQSDRDRGWAPKNSGDISHVPVHELGHALFTTLFEPDNKAPKDNVAIKSYLDADKIYSDALKDVGVDLAAIEKLPTGTKSDHDRVEKIKSKAHDKVKEISGYASSMGENFAAIPPTKSSLRYADDPHEVIAESLADYYYNRDKAADLSKAIVKRLKRDSSTYGLKQAGGVGTGSDTNRFVKNLRRYKAIQ